MLLLPHTIHLIFVLILITLPPLRITAPTNTTSTISSDYLKLQLLHIKPYTTPSQALNADFHRLSLLSSTLRRQSLRSPLTSGASTGSGQYFVDFYIGNPPQKLLLVADTGSDLIWVKCSACRKDCTKHHSPGSAFLARQSRTFSPTHCYSKTCQLVTRNRHKPCPRTQLHSPCWYEYGYADGSQSSGIFSTDTTYLNTSSGKIVGFKGLDFGCGFKASGPSVSGASFNGVMGLGRGSISFSAQLGRKFGNKFSYCLIDYTIAPPPTSYLVIGGGINNVHSSSSRSRHDVAFSRGNHRHHHKLIRSTPLLTNPLSPTFYYIGIASVSIDGHKLPISPSVWALDDSGNGGTVIDSGTTLSFLPEPAYRLILSTFKKRTIHLRQLDVPTQGFDLCVDVSGVRSGRLGLPKLRFELIGGAVFAPPPRNYFIDTDEDTKCLALQGVDMRSGFGVIGNLMQQGFLFEFDNGRSRLRFSRKGCGQP